MIKVLVAEDMHVVRDALVALLGLESDIEVVAEVAGGDEILDAARSAEPDVAVIDLDLPNLDGVSAAATLHEFLPRCRTLILTSLGTPDSMRRAMAARVDGFLLKDAPAHRLATAVRAVAVGRRVLDPDLVIAASSAEYCPLTGREIEVLRFASTGVDPEQIATELQLAAGTVRNYLSAIVGKIGARNRVDAIRIAAESGWLGLRSDGDTGASGSVVPS